jgi:hypothetical protein
MTTQSSYQVARRCLTDATRGNDRPHASGRRPFDPPIVKGQSAMRSPLDPRHGAEPGHVVVLFGSA